jgi:hypothetical protein
MHLSKRRGIVLMVALVALGSLAFSVSASGRHDDNRRFDARLDGYQEVPSISTRGRGTLNVRIANDRITYTLRYSNLEGTAQQAHIHFAQRHVNGGVVAFLCGGAGKPPCPASGVVRGEITAADIQAVPAQGIAAGELAEVIRAMRNKATYANVHTNLFPGGEIRGQILLDPHHGHGNGNDNSNSNSNNNDDDKKKKKDKDKDDDRRSDRDDDD